MPNSIDFYKGILLHVIPVRKPGFLEFRIIQLLLQIIFQTKKQQFNGSSIID